jgi:hypothetical protein
MESSHPAAAGALTRAFRVATAARRVMLTCAALVMVAGCVAACTTANPGTQPTSPAPSGSGSSGKSPSCPSTPAAPPPAHTLTFPQSIDGYQLNAPPVTSPALTFIGNNGCNNTEQSADYQNSQGSFVTIQAGHHANLWHTFNSFWGPYFGASGDKIVSIPAGPLGGQAGCGTDSEGTTCNWLDNDTFGSFIGNGPSMSQSQTASLMVAFRNAVEQQG